MNASLTILMHRGASLLHGRSELTNVVELDESALLVQSAPSKDWLALGKLLGTSFQSTTSTLDHANIRLASILVATKNPVHLLVAVIANFSPSWIAFFERGEEGEEKW